VNVSGDASRVESSVPGLSPNFTRHWGSCDAQNFNTQIQASCRPSSHSLYCVLPMGNGGSKPEQQVFSAYAIYKTDRKNLPS